MSIVNATNNLKKAAFTSLPKVLLYGDSITQYSFSHDGCWGALLADKLVRKCDVVNRGFSGYNTRWNKLILPRVVDAATAKDVVAVTIFLGANDASRVEMNPQQHIPLKEYKQNLVDMVDYLMSVGISRQQVILITPPPVDEPGYTAYCQSQGRDMSRSQQLVEQYAAACRGAASDSGTLCLDLYTEMVKQKNWQQFLSDGLHLSHAGSTFLDTLLWPLVERLTENLPTLFPLYDQVDNAAPAKTLLDDQ